MGKSVLCYYDFGAELKPSLFPPQETLLKCIELSSTIYDKTYPDRAFYIGVVKNCSMEQL